jgi:hypothetical protein
MKTYTHDERWEAVRRSIQLAGLSRECDCSRRGPALHARLLAQLHNPSFTGAQ